MINIRKNLVEEGKWGIKCPFPMQPKEDLQDSDSGDNREDDNSEDDK